MFKKISKIVMGVLNFEWDSSVRDKDNNIVDFGRMNIIYGNNYSGKTTLAKVFRAIEKVTLPPRYSNIEFSIESDNGKITSQHPIQQQGYVVRVFNMDFVKENLSFIVDEGGQINSFVLGEDNQIIEEEIGKLNSKLGSIEDSTGMYKTLKDVEQIFSSSNKKLGDAQDQLDENLKSKARKMKNNNAVFGQVIYHINNIKDDIKTVSVDGYQGIDEKQREEYIKLLKDEVQDKIPIPSPVDLQFDSIAGKAESLITKKITISNPIQELLNNQLLEKWVFEGRPIHNERKECGFCGQLLPADLKEKIDGHFNKESEDLIDQINQFTTKIKKEKEHVKQCFLNIRGDKFYSKFRDTANRVILEFSDESQHYINALDSLKKQIENRRESISRPLEFQFPESNVDKVKDLHKTMRELMIDNDQYASGLSVNQEKAKAVLRLQEVKDFIGNMSYINECQRIDELKKTVSSEKQQCDIVKDGIKGIEQEIQNLRRKISSESAGAKRIDDLLKNYFGHRFLSLKAIKDKHTKIYKFEIMRGDEKAYNLSEGEKNLIAFCYFIAKLSDIKTKKTNPVIWIDDPVSSLDSNHVFFILSIIREEIVERGRYKQLFISTHSLDFLGYLKNEFARDDRKNRKFFLMNRQGKYSHMTVMPLYMKEHMSDFNYSFGQIYKCANADLNDCDVFYNFPNHARKFMETLLYYLSPNDDKPRDKLLSFLGEDPISRTIVNRINNVYSHGNIERGHRPIEAYAPQMKEEAEFILDKIQKNNPKQYDALLKSIKDSS